MRLIREEYIRIIKSPFLCLVFVTFLSFNIFIIHMYADENSEVSGWEAMHQTILAYGVGLGDPGFRAADGAAAETYQSYLDAYGDMYEDLDMMSVLEDKKKLDDYRPAGAYGEFVDNNYRALQDRVEEIKRTGEGDYGFYPGEIYGVFRMLYRKLGQTLLLQMVMLMMLCLLVLMDHERIHGTRDIILSTTTGKGIIRVKMSTGLVCGLLYSILLMAGTYLCFFWHISFDGMWEVPVASVAMAENRGMLMYPFITFWRLTMGQYFALTLAVYLAVLLIAAVTTAALQQLLQNSYFAFLSQCLLYMFCYRAAFWHSGTFADLILALFNPVELWGNGGGWFMENDVVLSFAGNEFWCLACSGSVAVILFLLGRYRYKKMEI